jgi:4-methyl-5(b-hydroxyethyl)-thiazole monophosphate biosynthesis
VPRAQIEVVTAGLKPGPVRGARGTVVVPDRSLDDVIKQAFDMIVLPGGQPGASNLEADARIRSLIQDMAVHGKITAAICAAPKVLASVGVLDGKYATSFPGSVKPAEFPKVKLVEETVVQDGNIITSRGPGTAMDFALALIERLSDKATRDRVEQGLQRPAHHMHS